MGEFEIREEKEKGGISFDGTVSRQNKNNNVVQNN